MSYHLIDLHIHTALSGCADDTMVPPAIVDRCITAGLSIVAITDHNSVGNVKSVIEAAAGTSLTVITGIEAQTSEDIHIVALFSTYEAGLDFELSVVRPRLPKRRNRPDVFGYQRLLDRDGRIVGYDDAMLSGSIDLTATRLIQEARARRAITIASHADRPMHGYLYTLGVIPPGAVPDCFEFSSKDRLAAAAVRWQLQGRPSVVCSDAHSLSQVVPGRTAVNSSQPGFYALKEALEPGNNEKVVVFEDIG